jgi:hypothetical protein
VERSWLGRCKSLQMLKEETMQSMHHISYRYTYRY